MQTPHTNQTAAWLAVGGFVDELVRAGVRHFCVAPGSRSTPLSLMLAWHPGARVWVHLDERSASFFALGMAKALHEPVGLVCTSGTAAANFLPAVAEAAHSRVPLLVLTADRPHELRDVGAPQAMDQVRLFGSFAKWFQDLPEPDASPDVLRYTRATAARAAAVARQVPAGPVHLNLPYREPLVPQPGDAPPPWESSSHPQVVAQAAPRVAPADTLAELAGAIAATPHGLLICGPQDDPALAQAAVRLAEAAGYPLLADPLSGLRRGAHHSPYVLDSYDAFLRDAGFAAGHAPELVLRFGAMPVSKPVLQFLQRHPNARTVVVDEGAGWRDPTLLASDMLAAEPVALANALAGMLPPTLAAERAAGWCQQWQTAERATRTAIARWMQQCDERFEGKAFAELASELPAGATLFVGNSMPVRDLDTFFPGGTTPVRLLANRGVNGIDGVVSAALGVAAAGPGPVVLAIGDISLYHDSNGLLAAKRHGIDMTIVLLNNDGGGIFSFLAQASEAPQDFEQLFGTPHGLDFAPLAALYGATHTRPDTWQAFREALHAGLACGLHLIELRTERERNVTLHRQIWPAVAAALREAGL